MQPENGLNAAVRKHAGLAQIPGSAGGFLRGLEHDEHIVGQTLFGAQPPGQLQGDCHVAVVAAGMHPSRVGGGEVQPRPLLDGQGVGIGAKGNGLWAAKVKIGTKRPLHGEKHPAIQFFQGLAQIGKSLGQVPIQLWNSVQRPAVINDFHRNTSG